MNWYASQGQFKEAEAWSVVIGSALRRASGSGGKNYEIRRADWLAEQCSLFNRKRQFEQAVGPCQEAWEAASKTANFEVVVRALASVASVNAALGRRLEAEKNAMAMDEAIVRTLGEEHPARLMSLNKRAHIAGLYSDYETSGALSIQALRLGEKVAPGDFGTTIAQINACDSLAHTGDPVRALPYCDLGVAGMLKAFGADSDYTAEAHDSKAGALLALERYPDAIAEYAEVVRVFEKLGAASPTTVGALGGIGRAQLALGQTRSAVATLERALAMAERVELITQSDKIIGQRRAFAHRPARERERRRV
jgi:tetratricopeptide (TPR) repeat protein